MDEVQRAAYLLSQSVAAMIEAMGMAAENQYRICHDGTLVYDDKAFLDLIDRYGLDSNAAMLGLRGESFPLPQAPADAGKI